VDVPETVALNFPWQAVGYRFANRKLYLFGLSGESAMSIPTIPETKKLLIVDSEITCWRSNEQDTENMETIEIGALLIDSQTLGIMKEFRSFVKPIANPILSPFCRQLTSIKQSDIDAAEPFSVAFKSMLEFCGAVSQLTLSTWGINERTQIIQDCARHGMEFPFGENHFNIKELFIKTMGVRKCALKKAVEISNLKFEGPFHRALDDARYTLRILEHLVGLE
jgi:3'-5' exoribonuclease 1